MTNEERDALIAQGWTPPKVIDPDEELARSYARRLFDFQHPLNIGRAYDYFLGAIKEGRRLERIASGNYAIITPPEDAA